MADQNCSDDSEVVKPPMTNEDRLLEESTLMTPQQPSNPATGQTYISLRVKLEHKYKSELVKLLDDTDYCIYEHKAGTNNEHFHICIPGEIDHKYVERYRKRLRAKFGGSGNGYISGKGFQNGLHSFVFYCGHEGTKATYQGLNWRHIIEKVESEGGYYRKQRRVDTYMEPPSMTLEERKKVRDWEITYTNLVPQCVDHRRRKGLKTDSLKLVAKDLFETTKWKPSRIMRTQGVPHEYQLDFEFRIGLRKEYSMDWWTPRNQLY